MGYQSVLLRARAGVDRFRPMGVPERLAALRGIGFRPHGVFLPGDDAMRKAMRDKLRAVGKVADLDDRLLQYEQLQRAGEYLEGRGIPGAWNGQQAIARSAAPFRLVAFGRRGGKTSYAAAEAVITGRERPRSTVWVCAPDMGLVARCFDMVVQTLQDLGEKPVTFRNSEQTKLIVLDNGSKFEGVSLQDPKNAAGAAVDFAIIDEAAQVTEDAWLRAVLPPLADRQGHALLISSWEGEGGFFHEKAMQASRDGSGDWAFFQDATWDVNFYMFPEGRDSPVLEKMRREMAQNPSDFLEQFGAIPAKQKGRVFPEFRERVHVGAYPFDPNQPVILACDPSGGPNPYAVAVIQDYGERVVVIDEFYETRVTAEEVAPILDKRPWRANVREMICDSAWPIEVERWCRLGYPAYPVPEKPKVEERLPLYRNLLRDPTRYYLLYREVVNDLLAERGFARDADYPWGPDDQRALVYEVEERLSDAHITDRHLAWLRGTARIFFDRSCASAVMEHKRYLYMRHRAGAMNPRDTREKPGDAHNHLADALGYFCWVHHRFDGETPSLLARTLVSRADDPNPREVVLPRAEPERPRDGFLAHMRRRHDLNPLASVDLLRRVS